MSVPNSHAVRILAPRFVPLETIEQFIHSRSRWVIKNLHRKKLDEDRMGQKKYENGHEFLYLGKSYPLVVEKTDRLVTKIIFDTKAWRVSAPMQMSEKIIKNKLIAWYRREAGEVLGSRVFHFSRIMGQAPVKITVKTQKKLWGSCNHQGKTINLNWTLIMAPMSVIDYVVVHELCHLDVPNHSQRFWSRVAKFMPDYQISEAWLKDHAGHMRLP